MKYVLNYPIVFAILFIISFEVVFQTNMFLLLYIILIYVTLKTVGVNNIIKKFSNLSLKNILGKFHSEQVLNETIKMGNGDIMGKYSYVRNGVKYIIIAIKNNRAVKVWVTPMSKQEDTVFLKFNRFYVNRENIIRKLEENYFNV